MNQQGDAAGDAQCRRILVVRAGALGDTLMATPVVRALHRRYPDASIDFLSSEAAVPLLKHNPAVSRVLFLRYRNLPWALSPEKQRLARELRSARYGFAVLLESAPHFRRLLEHAGIEQIRSFRETPFDPLLHSIVNNLRAAGFADWQSQPLDMDLPVSPEDDRAAEKLLSQFAASAGSSAAQAGGATPAPTGLPGAESGAARPYVVGADQRVRPGQAQNPAPTEIPLLVGLHAGYGPPRGKRNQGQRLKGWGAENFAALGRMLLARGARLVLTGSAGDREEAGAIAARLPAGSFLQLAGRTTVGELAAVLRRLRLLVAVDSGPAHMAAALGTPLVVLWGPAILEQVRPISSTTPIRIVRHRVFCAPCYGTPMMKTCQRNICMEAISPERVLAEAVALLNAECGVRNAE